MKSRILLLANVIVIIVAFGLVLSSRSDKNNNTTPPTLNENPFALQTITSNEGGVEVSVTPINLAPNLSERSFEVDLNTHSVELSEDMVLASKLILDSGEVINPSNWEGDPPGGHHRAGVLKFKSLSSLIQSITLIISRVGGIEERKFIWNLKNN